MPTGYTAAIKDGITFKQYALGCARAFGALIMMRDDPHDAPIPNEFKPSDFHINALQEESNHLAQLKLMNNAETEAAATAAYNKAMQERKARFDERTELRAKYDAMLAQVVAWQAPTPDHVSYKSFMEEQIRESMKWDCGEFSDAPIQLTGAQWLSEEIARAERSIKYHTEEDAKERKRTEERNGWVKALRDALP